MAEPKLRYCSVIVHRPCLTINVVLSIHLSLILEWVLRLAFLLFVPFWKSSLFLLHLPHILVSFSPVGKLVSKNTIL